MKAVQVKKVNGYKSLVVNSFNCDLMDAYNQAKALDVQFYVSINGRLQMWGLFSVCEFLGIKDVSKF